MFRALALRQSEGEGLTLETSAFQSLYGGQCTLSTSLINQIPHQRSTTVSSETNRLYYLERHPELTYVAVKT